jgi:precorrin-2/cobalt-factor-2 C20-methyltransferase
LTTLGKLYGISVGPGDPELITLKGWRILKSVPVVAFPASSDPDRPGLAQQIVAEFLQPLQQHLALTFPFVQDAEVLVPAWQVAAAQVWLYLERGLDVAFVSEGDVSFYSTFTYLSQTLQDAHPDVCVEMIPGVCSPVATAAVLGMPLTRQGQRLVVLPVLYCVSELETAFKIADVVVLMKVGSVYPQVWSVLAQYQLLDHSYLVERATQESQVIYRGLRDRPNLQLPYFSLLIVQVWAAKMESRSC